MLQRNLQSTFISVWFRLATDSRADMCSVRTNNLVKEAKCVDLQEDRIFLGSLSQ